jgi:hypothetical protein
MQFPSTGCLSTVQRTWNSKQGGSTKEYHYYRYSRDDGKKIYVRVPLPKVEEVADALSKRSPVAKVLAIISGE